MEYLTQKYMKYFYGVLLFAIAFQLGRILAASFFVGCNSDIFVLILLSITNIILLLNSIFCNIQQRFTECKVNAKVLQCTILISSLLSLSFSMSTESMVSNIINIILIELVFSYRIRTIELLEKLADKYTKSTKLN